MSQRPTNDAAIMLSALAVPPPKPQSVRSADTYDAVWLALDGMLGGMLAGRIAAMAQRMVEDHDRSAAWDARQARTPNRSTP